MDDLGKKLRELRKEKGMSLEDLSRASGVTLNHVGRIERGETTNIQLHTLKKILDALEVNLVNLMGG